MAVGDYSCSECGNTISMKFETTYNSDHKKTCSLYSVAGRERVIRLDEQQIGGDHYRKHKFTPWEIIDDYKLDFYSGNVLKYLLRARDKNGVEDLKKCKHYLEKLIQVQEQTPPAAAKSPIPKRCEICGVNSAQFGGWCAWCDAVQKGDVNELIKSVKTRIQAHTAKKPIAAQEGCMDCGVEPGEVHKDLCATALGMRK